MQTKKSKDFSVCMPKCRYFCAALRRKSPRFACRNPCAARLPGHLLPFEAGPSPPAAPRPATSAHRQMNDAGLAAAGVGADLVRMSCGLEDAQDLIDDIAQALEQV